MRYRNLLCSLLCALLFIAPAAAVGQEQTEPESTDPAAPAASTATTVLPGAAAAPLTFAPHVMLICADNGEILYGKQMDEAVPPASITKLMTALIVLENCIDLSEQTTVTQSAIDAVEKGSTHIALQPGETLTLHELLGATLVQSANDASNVLAEHVAGSLTAFSTMMNDKARELGCENTNFVNANGLDAPTHLTTARDMSLIAQALLDYPVFTELAGARTFTIPPTNKQTIARPYTTKQNLLNPNSQFMYEGAFAGKNGWTSKAHHTLVTYAKRDGVTLIAVVMTGASKYNCLSDTTALFDYGFNSFRTVTLSAQEQADAVTASLGERANIDSLRDLTLLLPLDADVQNISLACASDFKKPALSVLLTHGNVEGVLTTIPLQLYTQSAEPAASTLGNIGAQLKSSPIASTVLTIVLVIVGVIAVVLLFCCIYRYTRIRKQRQRIHSMRLREQRERDRRAAALEEDGVDIDGPWPY